MRHALLRPALWVLGILLWCIVAGLLAGRLWMSHWHAPMGEVVSHVWYPNPWDAGSKADFAATGWFVLIALGLGIVTGLVAALLAHGRELLTLGAVLVGTCLASWLMYLHGVHVSPPDPTAAAKTAKDGTALIGSLHRPGVSALGCLPLGALIVLALWFLLVPPRKEVGSDPV